MVGGGGDLHWVGKDPNISLGWGYVPLTLIVFIEISFVSGNCMSEFMGLIYGSYEAKVDMSCLATSCPFYKKSGRYFWICLSEIVTSVMIYCI